MNKTIAAGTAKHPFKQEQPDKKRLFTSEDFTTDEDYTNCFCLAGQKIFNGYRVARFTAPITACRNCPLRAQC